MLLDLAVSDCKTSLAEKTQPDISLNSDSGSVKWPASEPDISPSIEPDYAICCTSPICREPTVGCCRRNIPAMMEIKNYVHIGYKGHGAARGD